MLDYQPQNIVNRQRREVTPYDSSSDDEHRSVYNESQLDPMSNESSDSDVSHETLGPIRRQRANTTSEDQNTKSTYNSRSTNFHNSDYNFVRNSKLNNFNDYPPFIDNGRRSFCSNTRAQYRHNNTNDPLTRIATVFEETLKSVKESTGNVNNNNLINRLISSKPLPTFTGEPLDSFRFKRSYDLFSQTELDDSLNVNRLSEALKGEAYEAVKHLFISGNSSKKIIETLEMRYGNK